MTIRIERARPSHIKIIARCMRARDIEEVMAGWGDVHNAITDALLSSYHACTAFWDMEPLALFGLRGLTVLGGSAEVWCFGTEAIDRHPIAFLRASKTVLEQMHRTHSILTNYVDVNDAAAVRWLTWLGARSALLPQERGGRMFAQFFLTAPWMQEPTCQLG